MLKEVKCLSCDHLFFHVGPLDEKGEFWGLFDEDQKRYESAHKRQGDKEWYECPTCHKKNWITSVSAQGKGRKSWISHVTE